MLTANELTERAAIRDAAALAVKAPVSVVQPETCQTYGTYY